MPDDVKPAPEPPPGLSPQPRGAWLRDQFARLPDWGRVVVALAVLVLALVYARPHVAVSVPEQPAPTVVVQAAPPAFASASPEIEVAGRPRPARKLVGLVVRHRVAEELQRTGFGSVGGDATPLSRAKAAEWAEKLSDDTIVAGAEVYGAPVGEDGPVLALVKGLLEWLRDNPELIRFLLSLLMLL